MLRQVREVLLVLRSKYSYDLPCNAMSLNIKNEATHARVRQLARLTGESMTEAVDRAVTERLERIRRNRNQEQLAKQLLQIGRECAALPVLDRRNPEDMLYDEYGLPK
jgi:antitoxin VapB